MTFFGVFGFIGLVLGQMASTSMHAGCSAPLTPHCPATDPSDNNGDTVLCRNRYYLGISRRTDAALVGAEVGPLERMKGGVISIR